MSPGAAAAPPRVLVLGAGITGLCAAYELSRPGSDGRPRASVEILEASSRVGGKVRSALLAGATVEDGPDSFLTDRPEALALARELGLGGRLAPTRGSPEVCVLRGGRLVPVPPGMGLAAPARLAPFLASPLFSPAGKLRMLLEPWVPPAAGDADESLADFARRRLGGEAFERLVGPMLGGIYAGDPERMSLRSAFPQLAEMERAGGLLRSMRRAASARRPREAGVTAFMTLRGGLSELVEALARRLPPRCVLTDAPVLSLRRREGFWEAATPRGVRRAEAVVSALPAPALAGAVEAQDAELAARLRDIPFVSTATATFVWEEARLPRPLRGFGFLAPRSEGTAITAATFSSSKFPDRAPKGLAVVRAFLGGAGREGPAEGAPEAVEAAALRDLDRILGLGGAPPIAARASRWPKANPQYEVGHAGRLDRLSRLLKGRPGLILAGCSYGGVGLAHCVKSGRGAAALALAAGTGRGNDAVCPGLA